MRRKNLKKPGRWSMKNFVYRKGQWVEVKDFNEDRWMDSTTGIHFWMERKEALSY